MTQQTPKQIDEYQISNDNHYKQQQFQEIPTSSLGKVQSNAQYMVSIQSGQQPHSQQYQHYVSYGIPVANSYYQNPYYQNHGINYLPTEQYQSSSQKKIEAQEPQTLQNRLNYKDADQLQLQPKCNVIKIPPQHLHDYNQKAKSSNYTGVVVARNLNSTQMLNTNQKPVKINKNIYQIIIEDSDEDQEIQMYERSVYHQHPIHQQNQNQQQYMHMYYSISPQNQQVVQQQQQMILNYQYNNIQGHSKEQYQHNKYIKKQKKKDLKSSISLTSNDIKNEMSQQIVRQIIQVAKPVCSLDMDDMEKQGLIYEPDKNQKRNKVQIIKPRYFSPEYTLLPQKKPKIQRTIRQRQVELVKSEQSVVIQLERIKEIKELKEKRIGLNYQAEIPLFQVTIQRKLIKKYDHKLVSDEQCQ